MPRFNHQLRDEQEDARINDELEDWEWRDLIHTAVYVNDPLARATLAVRLSEDLLEGVPLTQIPSEYLRWVLGRLIEKDQIPHLARGNVVKNHIEQIALMNRLMPMMRHAVRGEITKRLKQAASDLNMSYETVRATGR